MRRSNDQIETDTLLRDSAREFAREQEAAQRPASSSDAGSWQAYVDAGWPGMALGEDSGGIGADLDQCCLVLREAGRALLPQSVTADILIAPRLAQHSPEIAALMPELLAGTARFALVLPDESGIREAADGRIEGRSQLVPGGDQATHLLIPTGTGEATRLYLAASDATGVSVRPGRLMDGRGAARFEMSGIEPDQLTLLASGESARAIADELEALAICGLLSEGLGAFEAAFEMTVDYVQIRQQFKQPLASFQAVEHIIADVYCELEKARSLHMAMAGALETPGPFDAGAVARARLCLARTVLPATGRLIQISGGIALTEDYKLGRIYRRLQADAALFGGARRATDIIAGAAS
ncbi:MAG: acyl-CoA dehydrogenase family protein [Hoeflea sp.]|uniref:acyl-CoA dehydrogenase family protein n=1 Tax=Hoeflea sp. TaxID=1940281 RepID=UPI00272F11B8|nr:acyl-CoA dehydrogenase family protein [Hoeflea sp.]MDP2121705.1 acyl-CoA dehydrogenase family protein [Hoeflea sp.]